MAGLPQSLTVHLDRLPTGRVSISISTNSELGRRLEIAVYSVEAWAALKRGERATPDVEQNVTWTLYRDAIEALLKAF